MTKDTLRIATIPLFVILVAALSAGAALGAHAQSSGYRIHSGDQLAISVLGEKSLTQTVTVSPDGSFSYPLLGDVQVGGRTVAQVQSDITTELRRYVKDPVVSVALAAEGPDNVLVLGDVKTPGKYSLPGTSRLADAIAAAGGVGPTNGDYPDARLEIGSGPVQNISLQKLLRDGDLALNVPLGTDTVIYIPGPTPINVQVLGAVDHPGDIQISEGDRLAIAIAKAGNSSTAHANLSDVHVTSTMPNGATQTKTYNLYKELKGGDLSADPVLHKGDVVYVPEAKTTDRTNALGIILGTLFRGIIPF